MRNIILTAMIGAAISMPAQAQPTLVEQAFVPGGKLAVPCAIGATLVNVFLGSAVANTAQSIAEQVGLCPAEGAPPVMPTPTTPPTGPAGTVTPGLQFKVLAVKMTGAAASLAAGLPQTIYSQGDGFAVVVSYNAPGYLEVWSVDASGATFVEGVLLAGPAGFVALPKATTGLYRFSTAGGSDRIRVRFMPCKTPASQAFVPEANTYVAGLVGSQAAAVQNRVSALPSCPFNASTLNTNAANNALFGAAAQVTPQFSADSGLYTAVAPSGATAIVAEIELKRS